MIDTPVDSPARVRTLRDVWCGVLGVAEARDEDQFFAVGGDSLAAAAIVGQVRRTLGVTLTIQDVFNHPVFAELAALIAGAERPVHGFEEIRRLPRDGTPVPASLGQEQFFLLSQDPRHAGLMDNFYMAVANRLVGELDADRLYSALCLAVGRHEPLHTVFRAEGERVYQQIEPGLRPVFELTRVDGADDPDARIRELIDAVVRRPRDRGTAAPISLHVYVVTPTDHVVLLLIDHLVADGLSLAQLADELNTAYRELGADPGFRLPAPQWQFVDWVDWQRRVVAGRELTGMLRYWRKRLGPSPEVVGTPLPGFTGWHSTREAEFTRVVDAATTAVLRAAARRRNVTLFAYMLGGLETVMAERTGRDSFCVKTSIANRDSPEAATVFGPLAHDIFLRTTLRGKRDVETVVREVQRSLAEASLYGALPDLALWNTIWPDGYAYMRNPDVLYFSLNRVVAAGLLRLPGLRTATFTTMRGPALPGVEFAVHDDGERLYPTVGYTAGSYHADDIAELVDATIALLALPG